MARKKIIYYGTALLLVIIVLKFLFLPSKAHDLSVKPFMLRVRLMHDVSKLELKTKGAVKLEDLKTKRVIEKKADYPHAAVVLPGEEGVKIGQKTFSTSAIRLLAYPGTTLTVNGTSYRGEIDIRNTGGALDVINRVELEDYLKGVLPREINSLWPFEMLKAQAIASRSFAVGKALRRKSKEYDLTDDTYSQVYGGRSAERWRTTKAVEVTEGRVLEYDGKILTAYFHSNCGGHTQDALCVWNEGAPPLKGVKCHWCRWSPYFRWRVRIPTETILKKLNEAGHPLAKIDDIRVGARDSSGRRHYVRIKSGNKWFEIDMTDFRYTLGNNLLKSANLQVKKYPFFYLFSGYGWGHGVGMCQWGALGLSVRWQKAEKILKYYYPGAEIVSLKDILGKR